MKKEQEQEINLTELQAQKLATLQQQLNSIEVKRGEIVELIVDAVGIKIDGQYQYQVQEKKLILKPV